MPDEVVLDSSVIEAMFFKEDASMRALDAAAKSDLITLDLAIAEVGNMAWKQVVLCGADKIRRSWPSRSARVSSQMPVSSSGQRI